MSNVLDPESSLESDLESAAPPERIDDRFDPVATYFLVGIGLLLLLCLLLLFIGERRPPPGL